MLVRFYMRKARFSAVAIAMICVLSCFSGCGLIKKKDSNAWKAEAREQMPDKIEKTNAGRFYMNGHVYSFPFKVGELLENGWNYDNKDDKSASVPGTSWYTYKVSLNDGNKHTITLEAYNESEESCALSDAYVGLLTLDKVCGDVMFSGDISLNDNDNTLATSESILDYCADAFEFVPDNNIKTHLKTTFLGNDDNQCSITYILAPDETGARYVISQVNYECAFTIDVADYVTATMMSITRNDPSYINSISRKSAGEGFLSGARDYYAEYFLYVIGFDFESISTELREKAITYMDTVFPNIEVIVTKGSSSILNTTMVVTYTAPDDFDSHLTDAMIAAADEYDSESENLQSDPAFAGLVLDKLIEIAPDFTYTGKHTYELTYTGDEDQLDYDMDIVVLCMLGGYEYQTAE